MKNYPIHYKGRIVGQATLEKQGMFYRVRCQCQLPGDKARRIQMNTSSKETDLGICTRLNSGIGMVTRIAVGYLANSEPEFSVVDEVKSREDLFEVTEVSAFPAFESITQARFIRKDGKAYIKVSE